MTADVTEPKNAWQDLHPELARDLVDARLQLHHAAQIAVALGISYLPKQSDDSHTNLGWLDNVSALATHPVHASSSVQLAVAPHPFELLVIDNGETATSFTLGGHTIAEAAEWARQNIVKSGLDGSAFTLVKHYTIPPHAVGEGARFNASPSAAFAELATWYGNAARLLEGVVAKTPSAAPVRCWPHHFDIATLVEVAPGKTVGFGMEPGDTYYAEPYFYANMYPFPSKPPTSQLPGGGSWHTHEWVGAVLPGSHLERDGQRAQVSEFLDAAVTEARRVLVG